MKTLLNVLRAAIFAVAIYYFLELVFYLFGLGLIKSIVLLNDLKKGMNAILFWFLLFVVGILIISTIWYVFKVIAAILMSILARICPYQKFALICTCALSILYSLSFLIGYWFLGEEKTGFTNIIVGIFLIVACIELCTTLYRSVTLTYKDMRGENIGGVQKVLNLDYVPVTEITPGEYETLKQLYGKDITIEEAIFEKNELMKYKIIGD